MTTTTLTEFVFAKLELLLSPALLFPLLATLLTGLLCGLVSPIFNWRRLNFFGDTVAHAALAPSAVALWAQKPLPIFVVPFAILLAPLIHRLEKKTTHELSAITAVIQAGFLAIGVLIISYTGVGHTEISHLLLGDVLMVDLSDLILLVSAILLTLLWLKKYFREFLLSVLHADLAKTEGVNVDRQTLITLILSAICVVVSLKVAGMILFTCLVTLPGLLASRWSHSVKAYWLFSTIFSVAICLLGFVFSVLFDWPTGATIAALSFFIFIAFDLFKNVASHSNT